MIRIYFTAIVMTIAGSPLAADRPNIVVIMGSELY